MSEPIPPFRYAPIVCSEQSTIVAEFVPEASGVREAGYQSEAELEAAFIKQLQGQAYEYLPITSEAALLANLRRQLEKLNKVTLSDAEWEGFSVPASRVHMTALWKNGTYSRKPCAGLEARRWHH